MFRAAACAKRGSHDTELRISDHFLQVIVRATRKQHGAVISVNVYLHGHQSRWQPVKEVRTICWPQALLRSMVSQWPASEQCGPLNQWTVIFRLISRDGQMTAAQVVLELFVGDTTFLDQDMSAA